MTTLRKKIAVVVSGFFGLAALVFIDDAWAKKCEVTLEGANKGRQGIYTVDEEGKQWCSGDWGGTECTGGNRCKDIARFLDGSVNVAVFEGIRETVVITQGFFEMPNNALVRCTTSVPTAATSPASAVCSPIVVERLKDLMTSKEATDVSIARAVSAAVGSLPVVKSP
jgi:hypothetical protein